MPPQWQYDAGNGWTNVKGRNSLELSVIAGQHNVHYKWRIMVMPATPDAWRGSGMTAAHANVREG